MGVCGVPGCTKRSKKDGLKFYGIPSLRDGRQNLGLATRNILKKRRATWLVRIGKQGLLFEDTSIKVCSGHFVSGKPSKPTDVDHPDWAPSLLLGPDYLPASDPGNMQEPVPGQEPVRDQELLHDQDRAHDQEDFERFSSADRSFRPSNLPERIQTPLQQSQCENFCEALLSPQPLSDIVQDNQCDGFMESTRLEDTNASDINDWSASESTSQGLCDNSAAENQDLTSDTALIDNSLVFQDLQSKYSPVLKSHGKVRDQLTEAEVDKLELNESVSKLNEKCEDLARKNLALEERCNELSGTAKAQGEANKQLQEQLDSLGSKIVELEEQLKKAGIVVLTLDRLKSDGNLLKFYTGLSSFKLFDIVLSYVMSHVSYTSRSLEPWQELLLTLMRLRLAMPLQDVAFRFGISVSTACKTFEKWLYWLYIYLDPLINWPDRETLRLTMPNSFKEAFGNSVVVIIDCFEVFIERPDALDVRAMTWSNYKHHNTVKFLIGITPLGAISFVSQGWGGKVSDKHITANSGLYEKLLPGDVIMADRGFPIGGDVGFYCAKILIPAFTKGQSQLSSHDISDTRKIASLRVHVERVIGLVKNRYRILKSVLPLDFLKKNPGHPVAQVDEIVRVCCALTNLSKGIV